MSWLSKLYVMYEMLRMCQSMLMEKVTEYAASRRVVSSSCRYACRTLQVTCNDAEDLRFYRLVGKPKHVLLMFGCVDSVDIDHNSCAKLTHRCILNVLGVDTLNMQRALLVDNIGCHLIHTPRPHTW